MKGGEEVAAFEEVYRRYFADVYKYVLALSRDEAVAEEVTRVTYFRARKKLKEAYHGT